MADSSKIRKHVFVSGRVQGVGFRAFTRRQASRLGVEGWVRNLYDGRVEAVLAGNQGAVEKLINNLQEGPSLARVENIEIEEENYRGKFSGFSVKYSR